MDDLNHRLFEISHRFHQLQFSVLMPKGISGNDFKTLMYIKHAGDRSADSAIGVSLLAKALCVSPPAVSRTIRGLEERRLIFREADPKDRRNTFIRLTKQGENLLKQSETELNGFLTAVLRNMDREDTEQLLDYLELLLDKTREELERRRDQQRTCCEKICEEKRRESV